MRVIVRRAMIKAQPDPYWWPMKVAERARDVVPWGVEVTAQEDFMADRVEVVLSERWQRRLLRWARLERLLTVGRDQAAVRVMVALSDAPAGVCVSVRWLGQGAPLVKR